LLEEAKISARFLHWSKEVAIPLKMNLRCLKEKQCNLINYMSFIFMFNLYFLISSDN
jgi:hypothetical protein